MISASSRAFDLNCETTTWRNRLRNPITKISVPDLAHYATADGVFGKDSWAVVRNRDPAPTQISITRPMRSTMLGRCVIAMIVV